MSEAMPRPPSALAANEDHWRAYQLYEFNTTTPLEQSPRDLAVRAINRIAMTYGWINEIQRYLDRKAKPSISHLGDESVDELHARMLQLENCIQNGCDSDDAPPAR